MNKAFHPYHLLIIIIIITIIPIHRHLPAHFLNQRPYSVLISNTPVALGPPSAHSIPLSTTRSHRSHSDS